ncbi:unnamed protein product [Euphydryas editha]|uniref:Uncharacterized protein n=1 Tax=Euphydryas editha TaxID=104508 RepID=A0AAU9VFJ5_EUPED|nr:unnamed protein product [Euphydryas editha]
MSTTSTSNTLLLPKLKDGQDGFSTWKFRLNLLLEEKGIEIKIKPGTKEELQADIKARSLIAQCVCDKYIEIIKKCQTAAEMMKRLEEVFERKSVFNQLYLRKQLLSMKATSCEKLQDHFLKFDNIISSLESTGATLKDNDKVCHLLLTLPSEYDTVITTLETIDTVLTVDFVKSRLLDAELKLKGIKSTSVENDQYSFMTCYKCGRRGHKSFQCRMGQSAPVRGIPRGQSTRGHQSYSRGGSHSRGRGVNYRASWHSTRAAQAQEEDDKLSPLTFTAFSTRNTSESVSDDSVCLVVDSGATEHMIMAKYEQYMTNIVHLDKEMKIYVANGQYLTCVKRGKLKLVYNDKIKIDIEGLIVSNLSHNLLSVRKLLRKGLQIRFYNNNVSINNTKTKVVGNLRDKLYIIEMKLQIDHCLISKDLWHKRLGHANRHQLKLLQLPYSETPCEPCMKGESTRLPFKSVLKPRSKCIGELIHTDISGPVTEPALTGEIYYHTIIDDFTHFCEVYLLKRKSEATDRLIEYINRLETQTGNKVMKIRSDNGGEFKNEKIKKFCQDKGIVIQYTTPYSPQSNGVAERMNRTIYNRARTLLIETGLPKMLWGEAVRCAVYQINRCPSLAINFQSPVEKMHGNKNLSRLKVFGSKVWVHILPKQDKLLERAKEMRFVGYQNNGYRLWDPESNKIIVSRDVRFDETQIQYKEQKNESSDENILHDEDVDDTEKNTERSQTKKTAEGKEETSKDQDDDVYDESEYEDTEEGIKESKKITRSGRIVKKPSRYQDDQEIYTAYCLLSSDPQDYNEAIDKGWNKEINKELNSHEKLGTWELADLPEGKKAIDTKWIFRTKQDGTRKARLVAKGFQQFTLEDNYAPVAKISTIRLMISLAVQKDLPLKQFDVPTAFLNGKLDVDVFIKCPNGLKIDEGKVLKLKRALYGLKEAPKCWNTRFHEFIIKEGFTQSKHDSCLYGKGNNWILLYVDDILYLGKDSEIIKEMEKEFKLKSLGEISNYLGLEVTRNKNEMHIKQTKLIERLLEKFNMLDCKGNKTPMETNFSASASSNVVDVPFKELIGCLLYISTHTRPDITYAVSYLSRFLDKPTQELWKAGKRILRYLKETQEQGLRYTKSGDYNKLQAYSDADWAADKMNRKSTSGCVIYQGNNLITWFSRQQTCVALSTAEAEYIAGAHAIIKAL